LSLRPPTLRRSSLRQCVKKRKNNEHKILLLFNLTSHYEQLSAQKASLLDDSDTRGVSLGGMARVELMQKLNRGGEIAMPGSVPVNSMSPGSLHGATASAVGGAMNPSKCILLKNMFDPSAESGFQWEEDIKQDVTEECSKYGRVIHAFVDRHSDVRLAFAGQWLKQCFFFCFVFFRSSCDRAMSTSSLTASSLPQQPPTLSMVAGSLASRSLPSSWPRTPTPLASLIPSVQFPERLPASQEKKHRFPQGRLFR